MSLQLSLHPHTVKTNKAGTPIGVTVNPYIRLARASNSVDITVPPVFLQHGCFFGEGGDQLAEDEVPDWVFSEMKKCSKASLIEAGFKEWAEENLDGNGQGNHARTNSR